MLLTALALLVHPHQPQQKKAAEEADEAVEEDDHGDAQHLGRQLDGHVVDLGE
jgi:hypothetical protein